MVGASGFEPEASWTRTKRDTKLRHAPIDQIIIMIFIWNVKRIMEIPRKIRGIAYSLMFCLITLPRFHSRTTPATASSFSLSLA